MPSALSSDAQKPDARPATLAKSLIREEKTILINGTHEIWRLECAS